MKTIKTAFNSPWPLLMSVALATVVALATALDWLYVQPQRQAAPPVDPTTAVEPPQP
ncbi:MAG TPA: hypothetical protein V6D20_05920 [Candidatus Obscuribacterales bacterium]